MRSIKSDKKLIAIVGPTASGKTDLAKALYKKSNGVVISVDSRQIYRGLDIGTGKDKSFPQAMIDILEPGKTFSVVEFQKKVLNLIDAAFQKGKIPFLVGGAGFYLDSIIYERNYPTVITNEKLRSQLERKSIIHLYQKLHAIDSDSAERIGRHKRRLIRALEIITATGKKILPLSSDEARFEVLMLGIGIPREKLYQRIDRRVDERIKAGMITEVRELIRAGVSKDWLKNLGLEYKFITDYLDLIYTKPMMIEKLKYAIHAYARRQYTWLKRYKQIKWLKLENYSARSRQNLIIRTEEAIREFMSIN